MKQLSFFIMSMLLLARVGQCQTASSYVNVEVSSRTHMERILKRSPLDHEVVVYFPFMRKYAKCPQNGADSILYDLKPGYIIGNPASCDKQGLQPPHLALTIYKLNRNDTLFFTGTPQLSRAAGKASLVFPNEGKLTFTADDARGTLKAVPYEMRYKSKENCSRCFSF